MGAYSGPEINESGLVLCLDAGNTKSYPGSGTTWSDLSGNGNTGTLSNGPTYSSGSIVFDGSDDYVQNNSSVFDVGYGAFSVESFAYFDSSISNIYGGIFSSGSTGNIGIHLTQRTCWVGTSALLQGIGNNSTVNFPVNIWFHTVFTRSSDGTTLNLYLNGEKRFTPTVSTAVDCSFTDGVWGSRYTNNFSYMWGGKIALGRFYTLELTQEQVQQNFNALRGRFGI